MDEKGIREIVSQAIDEREKMKARDERLSNLVNKSSSIRETGYQEQPQVRMAGAPSRPVEFDLDHLFTYHAPDLRDCEKYAMIRSTAKFFAQVVLDNTPPGADQAAAIRKIREAVMTANASIALRGRL